MVNESPLVPEALKYPQPDADKIRLIESVTRADILRPENAPFHHKLLYYGVDIIMLLAFLKEVQKADLKNQKALDDFIGHYEINFDDKDNLNFTTVSLERISQKSGIYFPPIKREKKISLFNQDFLNIIGCHSIVQSGDPASLILCKTKWKPEHLANETRIENGIELAKDMWAILALNFETAANGSHDTPGSPDTPPQEKRVTAAGRALIDYYWTVVNAISPDQVDDSRRWISFDLKPDRSIEDEVFGLRRIFIGRIGHLFGSLLEKKREASRVEVIKAKTRRQIIQTILDQKLI